MRRAAYWLSLGLIFTIPFKEIFVLPGIGSVSRVLGLLVAVVWLISIAQSGYVRRPSAFHIVAFAFILWNTASILWSVSPDSSIERSFTYLRIGLFIWFIWDLYDTRTTIWRGCQAYVLGAWITAGSLFINYLNNVEAYHSANGRFAATGFNTNETGLLLALGLPLAWYLAVSDPLGNLRIEADKRSSVSAGFTNGLLHWLNFLYVPLALFSILLTASRGSLIATAPLLLVVLVTLGKTSFAQRALLIGGIVAAIMTSATIVPEQNLERLGTTSEEVSASDLNGRVTVWRDGFEIFENNVVLGVGSGAFRSAIETGKAPHNVFVALAVDLGLLGLGLFVLMLMIVFAAVWHQSGVERIVWLALLSTWLLGSMVGNWEYENVTWLFLCLIVKSAALHTTSTLQAEPAALSLPQSQQLGPSTL